MSENCNNLLPEPWFTAVVLDSPEHPVGFMEWTEGITQNNYHIILPDNSTVDAGLFMDLQQVFNNGSYTTYLVNRYNEL